METCLVLFSREEGFCVFFPCPNGSTPGLRLSERGFVTNHSFQILDRELEITDMKDMRAKRRK